MGITVKVDLIQPGERGQPGAAPLGGVDDPHHLATHGDDLALDLSLRSAHISQPFRVAQAVRPEETALDIELAQHLVAVERLGPEKVIWGTDSPFVDYEWEFRKMERATADAVGYDLIMGGNIARLLGL